jgi:hypothetical protein
MNVANLADNHAFPLLKYSIPRKISNGSNPIASPLQIIDTAAGSRLDS